MSNQVDASLRIFAIHCCSLYNTHMFALACSQFITRLSLIGASCSLGKIITDGTHRCTAATLGAIRTVTDRRWLMGAYVFFFAFLSPLLCWGSVGDPTHSHTGAHFVFAEPVLVHAKANNLPIRLDGQIRHHDHAPCLHPPGAHGPNPAAEPETGSTRAVPATLLAQLLIFVAWGRIGWRTDLIPLVLRCSPSPWPVTYLFPVPTPPPRLLSNLLPQTSSGRITSIS